MLTNREKEVMSLAVGGLLNKQVAGKMDASEITVKRIQRGKVMQKMRAESLVARPHRSEDRPDRMAAPERFYMNAAPKTSSRSQIARAHRILVTDPVGPVATHHVQPSG